MVRFIPKACLGMLVFLVIGCSPATGPAKTELPIHRLQEITDTAEVEKLALGIVDGAKPIAPDQGLFALKADELIGVVLGPKGWAQPVPKPASTDAMILLMSVPDQWKRFREPLMIKLKEGVAARTGHAWTKPSQMSPFVLKVGGYDYLGQRVDSQTANGSKAREYWLELPRKGRTVYVVAAGLPGFGAYFPDQHLTDFLKQLPKQELVPSTPAAP